MKTYEIIKNGTVHGTIEAESTHEAEDIYITTYGELNALIIEI